MRTIANILQDGKVQEIEALLQQVSFFDINTPLSFCNLKPISYAALCGNIDIVKHLVNKDCNLSVVDADCNLLTWALMCNNRQASTKLIEYISENRIYQHFNDGTQESHVYHMIHGSIEKLDYSQYLTYDGMSVYYYLLLSATLPLAVILDKFNTLKLSNIIDASLDHRTEDDIRRLARYFYIAGHYLYRKKLVALAIESFKSAIAYYHVLKENHSHDCRELSYIYYSLGRIYYKLSQWENAAECYKNAVIIHKNINDVNCKLLMDHQDLTNYRTSLAGYLHDEVEEFYFYRYIDFNEAYTHESCS